MIFSEIKTLTRKNLDDAGVTFYAAIDIDDSIQDAYDDIIAVSKCLPKKTTIGWQQDQSYYDFVTLGVTDYLGSIAVYNQNNRRWLQDNLTLPQLNKTRFDWELSKGTPEWWIPVSFRYVAFYPIYSIASGSFDLYYWAKAPIVINTDTPLISTDMQTLLMLYSTADLLEQAEEYSKANVFWEEYFSKLNIYKDRCDNLAKTDLLVLM